MLRTHALPSYTIGYKEKCLVGNSGNLFTENWWLANHIKYVSLVNTLIGGNLLFLEPYLEAPSYQATRMHRTGQYKTHNWRMEFMAYTHKHGHHGIPWQLWTCGNSVYQVLFLIPLLRTWERDYILRLHPHTKTENEAINNKATQHKRKSSLLPLHSVLNL